MNPIEIIKTNGADVYSWCSDLDEKTREQIIRVAEHPKVTDNVYLMADAHLGQGVPIGTIFCTKDSIVPNAVGVDIGCGICSMRVHGTNSGDPIYTDTLKKRGLEAIVEQIYETIPVGFAWRKTPADEAYTCLNYILSGKGRQSLLNEFKDEALLQLGTLGGGNHFIELQADQDGHLYVTIHTGSRNIGHKVGSYLNGVAVDLCESNGREYPADLAYIDKIDDPVEYDDCGENLYRCTMFATYNRCIIKNCVYTAIKKALGRDVFFDHITSSEIHNGAARLTHKMWHYKGAHFDALGYNTSALIPGSQGTASYFVGIKKINGTGFCSHGAGRKLSRGQAKKMLNLEEETAKMGNVVHRLKSKEDLDEAPGAYKDIDVVMENQKELVRIISKLTPLAVVKG